MKTADQIKEEMEKKLKQFEHEMVILQKEYQDVCSKKLPDFIENIDPTKIKRVFDHLEKNKHLLQPEPNYFDGKDFLYDINKKIIIGKYTITIVDQEGGGEGEGEHWHSVFKIQQDDSCDIHYYYIPGYYYSYDGSTIEWDSIYEVEPYEKVVTAWRKK
jgi:hypothetical protein